VYDNIRNNLQQGGQQFGSPSGWEHVHVSLVSDDSPPRSSMTIQNISQARNNNQSRRFQHQQLQVKIECWFEFFLNCYEVFFVIYFMFLLSFIPIQEKYSDTISPLDILTKNPSL
jgi:hypothetical protein